MIKWHPRAHPTAPQVLPELDWRTQQGPPPPVPHSRNEGLVSLTSSSRLRGRSWGGEASSADPRAPHAHADKRDRKNRKRKKLAPTQTLQCGGLWERLMAARVSLIPLAPAAPRDADPCPVLYPELPRQRVSEAPFYGDVRTVSKSSHTPVFPAATGLGLTLQGFAKLDLESSHMVGRDPKLPGSRMPRANSSMLSAQTQQESTQLQVNSRFAFQNEKENPYEITNNHQAPASAVQGTRVTQCLWPMDSRVVPNLPTHLKTKQCFRVMTHKLIMLIYLKVMGRVGGAT